MLYLTIGDTRPTLSGTVNADLTAATAILTIRRPDGTLLVKPAVIVSSSPTSSTWEYAWAAGDLTQTGPHVVELDVVYGDTTKQSFALDAKHLPVTFWVRRGLA